MNEKTLRFSERYVNALRNHLKHRRGGNLPLALRLGRQAVSLGIETLELARIHEQSLVSLQVKPRDVDDVTIRGAVFFTEALTPIVETHRAARRTKVETTRLTKTLSRRTSELATTNRQLRGAVVRRRSMETALKVGGIHYARLLKESLRLQTRLRQLTYQVLARQEDERQRISHELQDEIAQTLLGINVRLLTLKQEAGRNRKGFKREITDTQRLVARSSQSLRRSALKFAKS